MSKINQDVIINQLNKSGAECKCPFCGKNDFALNDELSSEVPVNSTGAYEISGKRIVPTVQMICKNCGFVAQFGIVNK